MNVGQWMAMHVTKGVMFLSLVASGCSVGPIVAKPKAIPIRSQLENLINQYDKRGDLSGSIYVRFKDGTIYQKGISLANDEQSLPNEVETLNLISSVSKGYTAAAILSLEEKELLSVNDPVADFFPEYPKRNLVGSNGEKVTLHHLLNHTSGIPDAYDDERISEKLFKKPISFADILNAIKSEPLEFNPGSRFSYSNTGYIILGEVVRRVSKQSFSEYVKQNLFEPLELSHTYVGQPTILPAPLATSYEKGLWHRWDYVKRHGIKQKHITDVFTDGNIVSTVQDVAKWAYGVGQEKLLSKESLKKMFRDYGSGYGYGWAVGAGPNGKKLVYHDGGWIGYVSYVAHSLKDGATVAYLLNQGISEDQEDEFNRKLRRIVFSD